MGLKRGTSVGLECGTEVWDWSVGLECRTGVTLHLFLYLLACQERHVVFRDELLMSHTKVLTVRMRVKNLKAMTGM